MKKSLLFILTMAALIILATSAACLAASNFAEITDLFGTGNHVHAIDDIAVWQPTQYNSTFVMSIFPTDVNPVENTPLGDAMTMPPLPYDTQNSIYTYPTCAARLTANNTEYLVSVAPLSISPTGFDVYIQGLYEGMPVFTAVPLDWDYGSFPSPVNTGNPRVVVAGDFNNDSIDEIAVIFHASGALYLMVATPFPHGVIPVEGYLAGPVTKISDFDLEYADSDLPFLASLIHAVKGDFNGDGALDLAVYSWRGDGLWLFSFNPDTLQADSVCTIKADSLFNSYTPGDPLNSQSFVAGDFDDNPANDELVGIVAGVSGNEITYRIHAFKFAESAYTAANPLQVVENKSCVLATEPSGSDYDNAAMAALNPDMITHWKYDEGQPHTIFALAFSYSGQYTIFEASLNEDFVFGDGVNGGQAYPVQLQGSVGDIVALEAGRFGVTSPGGQYAIIYTDYGTYHDNGLPVLGLLSLTDVSQSQDETQQVYQVTSVKTLPSSYIGGYSRTRFAGLTVGDLQGRSMELEPLAKLTINNHTQPNTILGAPPMHIDYIGNSGDGQYPAPTNMTAFPSDFNAAYDFHDSENNSCSVAGSTSYSLATSEEVDGAVTFGVPMIDEVKVNIKSVTEHKWERSLSNDETDMAGFTSDASAQTGWGDHIWFTNTNHYYWIYKVAGETAKTEEGGEEKQLCMVFSASPVTTHSHINGGMVEWYQPVHEPGNIFSYPQGYEALIAGVDQGVPLTDIHSSWFTGDASSTVSVSWSQGWSTSTKADSSNYYSRDNSISVSAKTKIDAVGLSAGASYDSSNSNAVSSSRSNSMTVDQTDGITITKNGAKFTDSQNYSYEVGAVVFGKQYPAGVLDKRTSSDGEASTPGPITLGYWVDPLNSGVGNWWVNTGNWYRNGKSDPALNHPQRYAYNKPEREDVLTFNKLNLSEGPIQSFNLMRGFFITKDEGRTDPEEQITNEAVLYVTEGQKVNLIARVYNYSFVDTDEGGGQVKVAFYRQTYDQKNYAFGDELQMVGEIQTIPNIIGFQEGASDLVSNNTLVSVKMDTDNLLSSGQLDGYYVFWVVVWLEGGPGEIALHGLSQAPGATIDTYDNGLPKFDGVDAYSNNIGLFKIPFCVTSETAASRLEEEPSDDSPELTVESVRVTDRVGSSGDMMEIEADVRASNGDHGTGHVFFYAGAPSEGGSCIDVETIPYLASGGTYRLRAYCRAEECGGRKIYLETISNNQTAVIKGYSSGPGSGGNGCFIKSGSDRTSN